MNFVSTNQCYDLNICFCCLNDLNRGLGDCYGYKDKEDYDRIIRETFNIDLTPDKDITHIKQYICGVCIEKLTDAHAFRNCVIENQHKYWEKVRQSLQKDIVQLELEVKDEKLEVQLSTNNGFEFAEENGDSFDDDEVLSNIKIELNKNLENADASILKTRKRKKTEQNSKYKKCKIKVNDCTDTQTDWSKMIERRGNGPLLRDNSLKLISNSTLCVFQWNRSRYRCFCCKEPFSDINVLKEHTKTHSIEEIKRKIISQQNKPVKVEITDLTCSICQFSVQSLSDLKEHLKIKHHIVLSDDLLIPFRIETELKCQLCFEKFSFFRHLNIHMNKHFQNQVCYICGAGFSNSVFLNLHKLRNHRPLNCKTCDVTFSKKSEKKQHEIIVHGAKFNRTRFPCPFCTLRFTQENLRVIHLAEKHGIKKQEFNCNICSKVFVTRSLLNDHVKKVHMKEKIHECVLCHKVFYTKAEVARHNITHTGEKNFTCSICNNLFASKCSLRRHLKRTHLN